MHIVRITVFCGAWGMTYRVAWLCATFFGWLVVESSITTSISYGSVHAADAGVW